MLRRFRQFTIITLLLTAGSSAGLAQQDDEAARAAREMAKKAQDPLGDVKALMTDNTIAFGGGPEDDVTFSFQLQPVYAIKNDSPVNMIFRAVVPIMGIEPGVVYPPIGPEPAPEKDNRWGLSDIMLQYFFAPKGSGGIKWGVGPQASLRTRTGDRQAGPGWGGGLAAVVFGGAGNWALGAIGAQSWGQENFSLGMLQLIAIYNVQSVPGLYAGYNNSLTFNWNADSGQKVTVPLGATIGKTLVVGGNGLDLSIGGYGLVARPDDGPDWQLKLGVAYLFN